jgi:hypothetical protein
MRDVEDETEMALTDAEDCGAATDYGSLDRDIQAQRVVALEVSNISLSFPPQALSNSWATVLLRTDMSEEESLLESIQNTIIIIRIVSLCRSCNNLL